MFPGQQEQPDLMQPPVTPPHPGGRVRAAAFLKSMASGAGLLFFAVALAEISLPDRVKPSTILGEFHGRTEAAEIKAAGQSKVDIERRMAEARAAPPANWAMEQQANAAQMQAQQQALTAQEGIANLADGACVMGGILGSLFGSDQGMHDIGKALQQGCGIGDQVRQGITDQIARAARTGSGVAQRSAPSGEGSR